MRWIGAKTYVRLCNHSPTIIRDDEEFFDWVHIVSGNHYVKIPPAYKHGFIAAVRKLLNVYVRPATHTGAVITGQQQVVVQDLVMCLAGEIEPHYCTSLSVDGQQI
jgi:hypothetical protein